MRKIALGRYWRGAPEWGICLTPYYILWTWRHRQGVFFFGWLP